MRGRKARHIILVISLHCIGCQWPAPPISMTNELALRSANESRHVLKSGRRGLMQRSSITIPSPLRRRARDASFFDLRGRKVFYIGRFKVFRHLSHESIYRPSALSGFIATILHRYRPSPAVTRHKAANQRWLLVRAWALMSATKKSYNREPINHRHFVDAALKTISLKSAIWVRRRACRQFSKRPSPRIISNRSDLWPVGFGGACHGR